MAICNKEIVPSKLEAKLFHGDVKSYKEALYTIFKRDFIDNEIYYCGRRVDIIHEKFFENKERSFWHIISEGEEDVSRTPISWRAEKLPWVRALISDEGDCQEYKKWIKFHDKTKRNRHYIWCTAINYMVILEDRDTYFKLITAYPVIDCKIKKYNKEYLKYTSKNDNVHQ